jgi:hypothetical protein
MGLLTPSPDGFAKLVIAELKHGGVQGDIDYSRDEFRLRLASDASLIYLGNIYAEFLKAPRSARRELIRRFASSVSKKAIPESFDEVRNSVLLRVNARAFYELWPLLKYETGGDVLQVPFRSISEHLGIGLGIDFPDSIVEINVDHLSSWGLSFDDCLVTAEKNLWDRSARGKFEFVSPGLWRSPWRDGWDASRILLTPLLGQLRVSGDPVAFVPSRDFLLVAGSEDAEAIVAGAKIALEFSDRPRFLTGYAFRMERLEWAPFEVDSSHPASSSLRMLDVKTRMVDYQRQKGLLEKKLNLDGNAVFVASLAANQKDSDLWTYAAWTKDIPTYLPKADRIGFVSELQGKPNLVGMAPWDRAVEVLGSAIHPQGWYPERYFVSGFPSSDQFTAMGLHV